MRSIQEEQEQHSQCWPQRSGTETGRDTTRSFWSLPRYRKLLEAADRDWTINRETHKGPLERESRPEEIFVVAKVWAGSTLTVPSRVSRRLPHLTENDIGEDRLGYAPSL